MLVNSKRTTFHNENFWTGESYFGLRIHFNCDSSYIQLACKYVCTVVNRHKEEEKGHQETLWALIMQEMKHLNEILSSEALSRLQKVIKEDGQAKKQLKRASELIAKVRIDIRVARNLIGHSQRIRAALFRSSFSFQTNLEKQIHIFTVSI
jgi:hypothetical protein